jgi:hypothetical protein
MSDVPSNLIPTRITSLPDAPVASPDGMLLFVYQGNNYKVRAGDLLEVAGVPLTRQVIAGTGMTGGGALSSNVTLGIATGGVNSTLMNATGVTPATYGDATHIPSFTVDASGRVTAASSSPVTLSGYVPVSRQVIASDGLTGGGALNANVSLSANFNSSAPLTGYQSGVAGTAITLSRGDHKHPAVDLSSSDQVGNLLGLSNGGTAKSLVPSAGALVWSGADGLYVGTTGLAGQVAVSGGAGAPTWGSALVMSNQAANLVYSGPASGSAAPTSFRLLVNEDLPVSGVSANTYGSAIAIPVLTVNTKGVVTSATTVPFTTGLTYQGLWNASTNTPSLVSSTGTNGYYYVVSVAGTTNLNGVTDWQIGDWAVFNGSAWQKLDQTNLVTSVNGYTGAVALTATDVGAATAGANSNITSLSGLTTPLSVGQGGTGVVASSGTNSIVLRDSNANATVNDVFQGFTVMAATGGTTALTVASTPTYTVTGSGGHTFVLPNATTLPVGAAYTFNNNESSGSLTINTNGGALLDTATFGSYATYVLLTNGTAAGTWDKHYGVPSAVSWSNNTLAFGGAITSAAWQAQVVAGQYGGTGVANTGKTITLGGNLTTSGAFATTLTSTATTAVTLPTSGNLLSSVTAVGAVSGTPSSTTYLRGDGTWATISASGTVTSVAMSVPAFLSVTGSPITTSGTLAVSLSGTALPIANGGTNNTATATAGGAAYGTGTAYAVTAAGTAGQVLTSAGASAPTWSGISGGTF